MLPPDHQPPDQASPSQPAPDAAGEADAIGTAATPAADELAADETATSETTVAPGRDSAHIRVAVLDAAGVAQADPPATAAPELPLPTVGSPDGRLTITDSSVTVRGQTFALRGLERADVQHVRWVLWILLGGLGLAVVLIAFLQNWLRTLPASLGMVLTATLLAYGQRGTNRLRLWQLSPSPQHFALPGELDTWQRLVAELNRRIARAHHRAAAEAAALLAEAEAARRAAEEAASLPAHDEPTDASALPPVAEPPAATAPPTPAGTPSRS